jgi:hypothetical protein
MRLRKINERRFCDDETGTYLRFLFPVSEAAAERMILVDRDCFLSQHSSDDYFGGDRMILDIGPVDPPPGPTEGDNS